MKIFKYTPKKEILRSLDVSKVGAWWDKEFFRCKKVLKEYRLSQEYSMIVVLKQDYKDVCYYSANNLKQVPVRGFLFPVEMFNEEKV